jgi:RND family efflux transporter MFP subunit
MSGLRQILLAVLVILVAGAGWLGYERGYLSSGGAGGATSGPGGPPSRGAGGGSPVITAAVDTDNTGMDVRAVGTAAAARAVMLYPEVTGIISAVAFQPGTEVQEGQELVHLRDADEQVAVDRARIALDDAQQALDRAERLAQSNNITNVALSDAKSAMRRAEIDLRSAELDLAKRSVTAPFDGTIGLTDITVGDLVSSSTALASLDDMTTVTVAFDVPERASGRVAVGQDVTATTASITDRTFTGTITAVDSRVDPIARTLKVEAKLPNDANVLKPGMAVNVELHFPGEDNPMVPSLAVQWDREGPYVWKLGNDSTVHRTDVRILGRRSGAVVVFGDLSAGDQVVVEGLQRLHDGATVRLIDGIDGARPDDASAPDGPAVGADGGRPQRTDS